MLLFMLVLSVEAKKPRESEGQRKYSFAFFFKLVLRYFFVSCVLKSIPAEIGENQKRSESFKLEPWLAFPVRNELSGSVVIKKQR